jgi:hypothetical protein
LKNQIIAVAIIATLIIGMTLVNTPAIAKRHHDNSGGSPYKVGDTVTFIPAQPTTTYEKAHAVGAQIGALIEGLGDGILGK